MREQFLWVEKYRQQSNDDCILPEELKDTFKEFVDNKDLPNLLLTGGPGVGKTTVAKALCLEMDMDHLLINGSEEGGIDTLRNTIRNYASTVSFSSQGKVVILDEADYLNPQSTQPALRGFIEEFAGNCRFILTCNFKNRIIEPLHSRCSVIEFKIKKSDKPRLAASFGKRVCGILDDENIKYQKSVVGQVMMKYFPDWRRVLNELQRYSVGGTIDAGIFENLGEISLDSLSNSLKNRDFTEMRKWVAENSDNDPNQLFRKIYDGMYDYLEPNSIPDAVLIIAQYQYQSGFVANTDINLVACLTEMMVNCQWK